MIAIVRTIGALLMIVCLPFYGLWLLGGKLYDIRDRRRFSPSPWPIRFPAGWNDDKRR